MPSGVNIIASGDELTVIDMRVLGVYVLYIRLHKIYVSDATFVLRSPSL